jgi:hypothetical protein
LCNATIGWINCFLLLHFVFFPFPESWTASFNC